MGALPSRETQQRGLYSHRHGRNRRNEVILIPLTKQFFPSADCPLFQHVFQSRRRRTAKYYYRPVRSAECVEESDYFCVGSEVNDGEQYGQFSAERLARLVDENGERRIETDVDYLYDGFSDTPEGLYNFLVEDNECCLYDTDEALRRAYYEQLKDERERVGLTNMQEDPLLAAGMRGFESVSFESFLQGYKAAKQYYLAKPRHTVFRESTLYQTGGDNTTSGGVGVSSSPILTDKDTEKEKAQTMDYLHRTTSPAAYYIRPIPCVIAARVDPGKATQPVDDPLYVSFDNSYIKVMGMFGLQPSTLNFANEISNDNTSAAVGDIKKRKNHINAPYEAEHQNLERVEQHLLKGVMFVDKDVGDQILGNMVLLAAHMYTRQCLEARISSAYIPMLSFYMRFPLSNIPMLQFVKEFRVRLRTLLEAGTSKSGFKGTTDGLNNVLQESTDSAAGAGKKPSASSKNNNPTSNTNIGSNTNNGKSASTLTADEVFEQTRMREEFYLFEEDVPYVSTYEDLLLSEEEHARLLRVPPGVNTSAKEGQHTVFMVSGMSVPTSRAACPLLSELVQDGDHRHRSQLITPQLFNSSKASRDSLLRRRKNRFRLWVEDGQLCLWASAAFARRACLLLAQQLNSAVHGLFIPDHRTWIYRGLLHPDKTPPPPQSVHDVLIVAADIPSMGLWQGDVLRCSTAAEVEARSQQKPLPLPIVAGKLKETDGGTPLPTPEYPSASLDGLASLLPRNCFWVRAAGGLDDSFTNFSEPNAPLSPKAEKQLKELQAEAGVASSKPAPLAYTDPTRQLLARLFTHADRREGTLNLEDVILSWMKSINIATRNAEEGDDCWVRRPDGTPLRVDRYLIRRYEHDGVRYFIGVTPRFAGQQRRIDRVLGQVLALAAEGEDPLEATEGEKQRQTAKEADGSLAPFPYTSSLLYNFSSDEEEDTKL
ncbi:hypothetical protein AGDE_16238 [Angomonas deanei]|uniref:Uncharacterized protein n=1 Tax=Angomonas deanei TaxID=59799 RepID=A0A7G2C296_9TRYP|nr:hypothetical protein AGDE_16238 [Angomonas deanei]CAD2213860.1 hypothetical protein, conserved [Angomonas deanei]|eukprot:EPY17471.1 hypothetical protein AGDE_16238 [Angomonas deanei]